MLELLYQVSFLQLGVFNGTGQVSQNTLNAGDVGFAPRGSGHWLKTGSQPAWLLLIFNSGVFTDIESFSFVGNFPTEVSNPSRV